MSVLDLPNDFWQAGFDAACRVVCGLIKLIKLIIAA